ncbi:plasmid mobilization relaxosome protein MobC [Pusillimonas sp. ANT_WB101]|uniref:plasmid mobilization relaxosome protein MobC n=1 Tax=Pusillimonas sp. ANT_WB101 TaxID=2597356 RepID=UPI0011EF90B3|nr:plasmid mobilization relaxosome protein MobC [Pusillimonas sp. ANT_WB101]KAA0910810.1 MobC family plasmid mobilization relaxosome protein [Pusillimonas sp. ANT_WB101]
MEVKAKRYGRLFSRGEKRTHCVSVRLNASELKLLDMKRGALQRGAWMRLVVLQTTPKVIPSLNIDHGLELARIGININQISHRLNSSVEVDFEHITNLLQELRSRLISGIDLLVALDDEDNEACEEGL